jgi:energy-coupling factor transport system ATP-binding protein
LEGRVRGVLEFLDVTFRYRPDSAPALSRVSLTLAPGEMLAVVGVNGSGKSTLARLCDGLLTPGGGRVLVDGLDTAEESTIWDVRALVGMVFQDPDDQIVGTVVEEDCAFGPENMGVPSDEIRARVDDALAVAGLAGLQRREPHLLSEGQKQRLAIAGALAMRPRYLVFDEPTAMLDPAGRRSAIATMQRLAREEGHGVLIVSHDVADVSRADRVIGLAAGSVVFEGTPAQLLTDQLVARECGLHLSDIGVLAADLRTEGIDVPVIAVDAESLVDALWR